MHTIEHDSPATGLHPGSNGADHDPLQEETRFAVLSDWRQVGYVECGARGGFPVLAFHGLPGSRVQRHPDSDIARRRGVRVIHVERPGFGMSTPLRDRTLAGWAADVQEFANRLEIDRFAIAAVSGGGPFALACAALLGDRVTRVAIAGGVGLPGSMRGRCRMPIRMAFALAPHAAWLLRPSLRAVARLARNDPDRYLRRVAAHLAPEDAEILARPEVAGMFARDLREAFRQGTSAMLQDLTLMTRPWMLPLSAVRVPLGLWHGEADRIVPPSASASIAAAIPSARVHLLRGEGHFMIFDRWAEILDWLAQP